MYVHTYIHTTMYSVAPRRSCKHSREVERWAAGQPHLPRVVSRGGASDHHTLLCYYVLCRVNEQRPAGVVGQVRRRCIPYSSGTRTAQGRIASLFSRMASQRRRNLGVGGKDRFHEKRDMAQGPGSGSV